MQMIYTNFIDVLKKIGVTEMEALGNEFDPNLHNAIKKTEDENFGEKHNNAKFSRKVICLTTE